MRVEPKRILFILHLPPPIHGAALVGKYIKESKLINSKFECEYINLSTSWQIQDIGKSRHTKIFLLIKLYFKILLVVLKQPYDIIYLTINSKGKGLYKELPIVFFIKLFNKKIVYHYHNKGIIGQQNSWLLDKLYRYQFKNSRVILLSPKLYFDINKYVGEERVYYCPNGVPIVNRIDLSILNSQRNSKEKTEVLFLSNIMKQKGVFTLLEACKILREKGLNFRTYFVGTWIDINQDEFYNYVFQNNLKDIVSFENDKYDDEKYQYFARTDIFCHPTENDCFPLVILEAMQFGLPVISTNEGAIPDIIKDNYGGYIIPPKDPEALAEKIEYLINNPILRLEMGGRNIRTFINNYSLERFENNFLKTIEGILKDFV